MLYVKLNQDQVNKVPSNSKGYSSFYRIDGKLIKENVTFCSNRDFIKYIGVEEKKEFIEI